MVVGCASRHTLTIQLTLQCYTTPTVSACPTVGDAGQYATSGYCFPCPSGQFSSVAGATSCAVNSTGCRRPGYSCFSSGANSSFGVLCAPGFRCPGDGYSYACDAGTYSGNGSTTCLPCVPGAGRVCPYAGTSATGLVCSPGTFANYTLSNTSCQACPAGYACATGVAQLCPAGTTTYYSVCQPCYSGQYNSQPGAGYGCAGACPIGWMCPEGSPFPIPCPSGRYNGDSYNSYCSLCDEGTALVNQCLFVCFCLFLLLHSFTLQQ